MINQSIESPQKSLSTEPRWGFIFWALVAPMLVVAYRAVPILLSPALPFDTEFTYLPLARKLLEDSRAFWWSAESLRSAPGTYVYMALANADLTTIKAFNLVMTLSGMAMAFDIARRVAGMVAAASTTWLFALSPVLIPLSIYPMVEPPSLFFLTLWLWSTAWAIDSRRALVPIIVAGLALTAATLTRATLMYWIPAIVVLSLVAQGTPRLKSMLIPWSRLAAIHLIALACVGAYIAKNAIEFSKPSIATGAGAALYFGNLPTTHGQEPPFYGLQHDDGFTTIDTTHLSITGDQRLTDAAKFIIRNTSLPDLISLYSEKIGAILFFSKSHLNNYSDRIWRISLVTLALAGLWLGRKRPFTLLLGLLTLYFVAVHVPVLYNPRYSIVALDVELTLLAGIGIGMVWQHSQRWRTLLALLAAIGFGTSLGALHQRYSAPAMVNFDAIPLHPHVIARPENVTTSGFAGDPFNAPVSFANDVGTIEWNDTFVKVEEYSIVHLQVKELTGECTRAWMSYTNEAGLRRDIALRIQSLRQSQDFTRGVRDIISPGLGKQFTLSLQCSKNARIQFGSMGMYLAAPGLYYRALRAEAQK